MVFDEFPDDVGADFANKHNLAIWADSEVVRLIKSLPATAYINHSVKSFASVIVNVAIIN